ncbi:isopeptide-forming domain-containing fimbrial protein [Deinococcus sedimenti]|uniref:DUF11 domain-containing protein n=1 Tax=Deinococcus sedimenti TaxID=1867090 RepID=A0ABQ2SA56_9DEIO|nr:isopeptide-forming domain-containing fimbrial protein [Deinococcus sedimenti]GGS09995.1 hypothetical protein GCM10008960_40230 [Deinococcus sedimenti]
MKRLLPLTALSTLLIAAGTPAGQVIENTATYEDADGRLDSNTVRVTVQPVCAAELTPDRASRAVRPGDTTTVPYTLRNTGNATRAFPLQAQVSGAGVQVTVTPDLNGNGQPDDAPASTVTLEPDQAVTVLVTSAVATSGTHTVTLISGCDSDLRATLTLGAQHQPPLITKTVVGAATIEEGQPVTYTIRVTNPENVTMPDVTVEDVLSSALTFTSVSPDEGVTTTPTGDGRTRVAWRTDLAPRETRTYTLTARVKSGTDDDTEVSNTASATNEGGTATSTPPAVIRVFTSRIVIQKTVSPLVVDPGGRISYALVVTNPSTTAITSTVVTDTPDPQLTVYPDTVNVNGKAIPATLDGGQLRIPVGTMRSGESVTITYDARVPVEPIDQPIRNRALASALGRQGTVVANITSNLVAASVTVRRKLGFSGQDLIGRVYVDRNGNGRFDAPDQPVPGARILMAGGREALTDSNGLYAFANVTPGLQALRLDPRSVPFTPADQRALNRLWNAGTAVTDVVALTSQDFPLRPNQLAVQGADTWTGGHATVTFTATGYAARALHDPTCIRLGDQVLRLTRDARTGPLPAGPRPTPEEVTCP